MSLAISDSTFSGVPRLSESSVALSDDFERMETQEYFCPQGHAFSIDFLEHIAIPVCWECPTCETLAVNYPL